MNSSKLSVKIKISNSPLITLNKAEELVGTEWHREYQDEYHAVYQEEAQEEHQEEVPDEHLEEVPEEDREEVPEEAPEEHQEVRDEDLEEAPEEDPGEAPEEDLEEVPDEDLEEILAWTGINCNYVWIHYFNINNRYIKISVMSDDFEIQYLSGKQIAELNIDDNYVDYNIFIIKREPVYADRQIFFVYNSADETNRTYCFPFVPLPGFCSTYRQIIQYNYVTYYKCYVRNDNVTCCCNIL